MRHQFGPGNGGFGAGDGAGSGNDVGGGGGLGAGGAWFISNRLVNGVLEYDDNAVASGAFSGNTVNGGTAPTGAVAGSAIGPDIFLQSGGSVIFDIGTGVTLALPSVIKSDVAGPSSNLLKRGSGTLDLRSGAHDGNDFKANINLQDGILIIGADNHLGNAASILSINSGTLNTTGTFTTGKITTLAADNATIDTNSGTTLTLTTVLTGSGALIKEGGGGLTFTQDNAIPADLTLNNGTLDLTGTAQSVGTFAGTGGDLTIGTSLITTSSVDSAFLGTLSGGGSLIKEGSSTLILSGSNNYSGGTTFNEGKIQIANDTHLGTAGTPLTFNGGTLQTSGSFTTTRPTTINSAGGIFEVDGGTTLIYNANISGIGRLIKNGEGTLQIQLTNGCAGGTVLNSGKMQISNDDHLGAAGTPFSFNGGALHTSGNLTITHPTSISSTGAFEVDGGTTLTYNASISGAGSLMKSGAGTLKLLSANTYVSGTTISNGTLETDPDLLPTGGNIVNNGALILNNPVNTTFDSNLSGNGSLQKMGAGVLTLSGASAYNGAITIDAGTLKGTTTSISGNITNNTGLIFDQLAHGTYSGVLSGVGPLSKLGTGSLTFSGNSHSFSGNTGIDAGSLIVTGSLGGNLAVSPSGILKGTGTVGSVVNSGLVIPGASIGTLTINGNYTQNANGKLTVEIDDLPPISDLLFITGASGIANLDGTLQLNVLPGFYEGGMTYTIIQANAVNGTFSQFIETHPLDFVVRYFPQSVEIFIPFTGAALPLSFNQIANGSSKSMAKYLFSSPQIISPDLIPIFRTLLKLPAEEFPDALLQLTPQQFGSLPLSILQTATRIGASINRAQTIYTQKQCNDCTEDDVNNQSWWLNPIGYYYKNNEMQGQIPFNQRTYGFTLGYDTLIFDHLFISGGAGYAFSNLHWLENNGNATIQSVYLAPSIGCTGKHGYVGLSVVGSRSFYDVDRKIHFGNFKDTAHNNHRSWDLLAEIEGALNIQMPEKFQKRLFLMPTVRLDYLNIFERGYRERNAGPINLSVKNKHSAFFRPECGLRFIKEYIAGPSCFTPNIYVGYLRNIPLTNSCYSSRFFKQTVSEKNVTTQSYRNSTGQLVLETGFAVYKENLSLEISYNAMFGNHYNIQTGSLNMQINF